MLCFLLRLSVADVCPLWFLFWWMRHPCLSYVRICAYICVWVCLMNDEVLPNVLGISSILVWNCCLCFAVFFRVTAYQSFGHPFLLVGFARFGFWSAGWEEWDKGGAGLHVWGAERLESCWILADKPYQNELQVAKSSLHMNILSRIFASVVFYVPCLFGFSAMFNWSNFKAVVCVCFAEIADLCTWNVGCKIVLKASSVAEAFSRNNLFLPFAVWFSFYPGWSAPFSVSNPAMKSCLVEDG